MQHAIVKFENDVKEYGIQTYHNVAGCNLRFENDVKEYGIQTMQLAQPLTELFENDVKEYGIQTTGGEGVSDVCLRMM